MKLIEKFKEKVLNSQDSFILIDSEMGSGRVSYFVQGNIGEARYVYGCYSYGNANFRSNIGNELKLLAIIRDSKIYVCDEFFFNVWQYEGNEISLPEGVSRIAGITECTNNYIRDVIFPEFYSKLEALEVKDTDTDIGRYKIAARKIIFSGMDSIEVPKYQDMFNGQDVADMLCGFMDFNEEAGKRLEKEKDKWFQKKAA